MPGFLSTAQRDDLDSLPQQELVDDLITIISHFSGKMYGLRGHKHKEVVGRAEDLFAQA
jgi:putative resolvase